MKGLICYKSMLQEMYIQEIVLCLRYLTNTQKKYTLVLNKQQQQNPDLAEPKKVSKLQLTTLIIRKPQQIIGRITFVISNQMFNKSDVFRISGIFTKLDTIA